MDDINPTAGQWPPNEQPETSSESNSENNSKNNSESNWSGPKEAGIRAVEGLSELQQNARYLSRIAQPLVEAGLYASIHHPNKWFSKKRNKWEVGVPGFAFTDLSAAMSHASAIPQDPSLAKSHFKNVYLAMGGEIATKNITFGENILANRSDENVGACNCLWMDIDVKPDDENAYGSRTELTVALQQFLMRSGVPFPNIMVNSGRGGVHLYWLFDRLLKREEWQPYAEALVRAAQAHNLKIDAQCTINACRLLRIPGTFNFKTDPPSPVTLIYDDGEVYSVEALQSALQPYWGTKRSYSKGNSTSPNDDLMGGMQREARPRNIDQVAEGCPFVRDTLTAGGANLTGEVQWWDMLRVASHCDAPEETAQRLCHGSQWYDAEDTLLKLAETQKAQEKRGYPRCATLEGHGAKPWCETCKYRGGVHRMEDGEAVGSPLNTPEANAWVLPPPTPPRQPLVGGKPLVTTLPPRTLQDLPGMRERIMDALDQRLSADPYTFQSGERLISLRISPGAAVLFPQIVDRDASGSVPAVTDEGDMPVMLETTDADVVYLADQDYWLGYAPGRVAEGEKPKLRRVHAPAPTCKLYMELSRAKLGIRPLTGLARVPIIDNAGSLDFGVGYHKPTGVFRDRTPILIMPDDPTGADCEAAQKTLLKPFGEYTFADQKMGEALMLTLNFTALERPFIPTAPMFGINGVAGVGKGKLIRAVTRLAFDTEPRFMTYGFNAEEFDKRVGTMFRIPAPCLVIDNANGKRISNDALESIITEGKGHVRTLGKSENIHVVNRSLLVATGRGLEFSGDMTRREFTLNLLAADASPETRVFKLDPPTYVAKHRDELLTAAFTLMRAFRKAGMPKLAKTAVGSFPEWERRVRDMVMWLTGIDVTTEFERNREIASDKQNDSTLLHALYGVFASRSFRATDVQRIYDRLARDKRMNGTLNLRDPDQAALNICHSAKTDALKDEAPKRAEEARQAAIQHNAEVNLFEALEGQFGDKPVNTSRLGWWARSVDNTHIGQLHLTRPLNADKHTTMVIVRTEAV